MTTLDIQKALKRHGFDPGPIDGEHRPSVDTAIIRFKRSRGLRARPFVGPITTKALKAGDPKYKQPWLIEAGNHMGLSEIPGKRHNPTILRWIKGLGGWFTDDETPWCGTFVGHCLRESGLEVPRHWYRAKAYLEWGVVTKPCVGAIIVFGRKGGGHVGFVVGESSDNYYVLGGNQRNQVNITPIAKGRYLGCRWPKGVDNPKAKLPKMSGGRRTTNEA